jgi:hypothetical protein
VRWIPLRSASASWLSSSSDRRFRMFFARTSRRGPLWVRFTPRWGHVAAFIATADK